ncbi:acetyl/propionyl/methylcrotonyl-CoA carboxylase subunit alpha [Paraferrimonas haliotis]|uniref:Biotin carboxylase n=1 Tax=Paraferrimonas haliotis TaxID=2013866 RepID=A0AA37WY58_9GAMM|nr:acetyl/propionyl/methylcrotonyl-CoA carboxylase subunit alpha [Paraferrimonas haliotis]GLS84977.1 3-methylcrotonyl-CoA carboxylase subunit alpha [Paraferrimonas haliotis]
MFSKILIANRGEIACRVIKTANAMGIATVAVFSEADRSAKHVAMADEAFCIGPAPSSESYLQYQTIIDCAQRCGVEAIHPGYGFLSEHAGFARACEQAGIQFIGPSAKSIELMGSKSAAKAIMADAGVPLVPGYHGADQSDDVLLEQATGIGYPLMVKAALGGGGKGMRLVNDAAQLSDGISAARREAMQSFGDDTLLLEAFIKQPRHVEVQVFADNFGNAVYLGDRDCSIQRRHQKVVEEAPAPGLSAELRKAMGEAAVKAALAIDYRGAGTVEFLLDSRGEFYFMEMNTRLQVEHPVTEMTSGQDLVEWQLRVANGQTLPLQQSQIRCNGHAIEVRVYAEDPKHEFLPCTGTIELLVEPTTSEHVRLDTGVRQGDEISRFYDPMIAKLITSGADRPQALARMRQALQQYRIGGLANNLSFLAEIIEHPSFAEVELTTAFIEEHGLPTLAGCAIANQSLGLPLAALYFSLKQQQQTRAMSAQGQDSDSPWSGLTGWQLNDAATQWLTVVDSDNKTHRLQLTQRDDGWQLVLEDGVVQVTGSLKQHQLQGEIDGFQVKADAFYKNGQLQLFVGNQTFTFCEPNRDALGGDDGFDEHLNAPMNGTIVTLLSAPGERVAAGDGLVIMEAMKMEYTITAAREGVVNAYYCNVGDMVNDGTQLVAVDYEQESES